MNSEERALQVIHDYDYSPYSLAYLIAAAIDSAVAAEREQKEAAMTHLRAVLDDCAAARIDPFSGENARRFLNRAAALGGKK